MWPRASFVFALAAPMLLGCSGGEPASPSQGVGGAGGAAPDVDSAAVKFPTIDVLWSSSIARTCGPNNGVCHNSRQFPDMQTLPGLLGTIGKRCNQDRDTPVQVDNLCEPLGDSLRIDGFSSVIGQVALKPNAAAPQTIELRLRDAAPASLMITTQSSVAVVRKLAPLPDDVYLLQTQVVPAKLSEDRRTVILDYTKVTEGYGNPIGPFLFPPKYIPGAPNQVRLGDLNGDGVYGAELGGALVVPGDPKKSYLFLRAAGPLSAGTESTTMSTSPIPAEQQMPAANYQYWDAKNSMAALYCWIRGLAADGSNAQAPIDYAHCDLSEMKPPVKQAGEAVTFSYVYQNVLAPSCAGPCHYAGTAQPTSFLMGAPEATYETLLGAHGQGPSEGGGLPFVTRNDPAKSFLFSKLSEEAPASGTRMPPAAPLAPELVDAVKTWIEQGAVDN